MGCFHSSSGDSSSSRNKNKNTADESNLGAKTEDGFRKDRVRKSKQPIVATGPVDETNPQKTPEDYEIKARTCTFAELAAATENFKDDNLLGEGGFGKVYKGKLEDTDQIVAVKRLNPDSSQGTREFLVEVLTLSIVDHPNLITLIGYCAEGMEKLLVYEFMPLGSLDDHLHGAHPNKRLDWNLRMKIAAEAARGLYYLHHQVDPPIIYRDFKTSNILLDEEFHVKLSDFGISKFGPVGDKTHVSTRVIGTYGYCAPDYAMTGNLTFHADIYSFGVVLLELITGRKAIDDTKPSGERNLVSWAQPLFKKKSNFRDMVDPALEGRYPWRRLYQALATCAICLYDQPSKRPTAEDIVRALDHLASHNNGSQKASDRAGPSGVKNVDQGEG